jgi:hypothetical protein
MLTPLLTPLTPRFWAAAESMGRFIMLEANRFLTRAEKSGEQNT